MRGNEINEDLKLAKVEKCLQICKEKLGKYTWKYI